MTPDPIGLEGGDVNLYAYVWGDPINWVDPWGLHGDHSGTIYDYLDRANKAKIRIPLRPRRLKRKPKFHDANNCFDKCLKEAAIGDPAVPDGEADTYALGKLGKHGLDKARKKGIKTTVTRVGSKFIPGLGHFSTAISLNVFRKCMKDCECDMQTRSDG